MLGSFLEVPKKTSNHVSAENRFATPQRTFVDRTYSSRGHASSLRACPISISHCPAAYTSAMFFIRESRVQLIIGRTRIKEIDPMVPSSLHAVLHDGTLLSSSIGQPSSQGEDRYLESSRTKSVSVQLALFTVTFQGHLPSELHILGVKHALDGRHCELR